MEGPVFISGTLAEKGRRTSGGRSGQEEMTQVPGRRANGGIYRFPLQGRVSKTGGETEGDGYGGRGEGAGGPNRMGEAWTYSRGTRPILHDGNSAPLSEDYDPSEIATDHI